MHRRQVIKTQIEKNGWTKGAELGLWDGRSYLWLLETCPDITLIGVDAWKDQGFYQGTDEYGNVWDHRKHENTVRDGAEQFGSRAVIIKADTSVAADLVMDGTLDFVFIDADHSTHGVLNDIDRWKGKLSPTGKLMGHDIDWPSVEMALGLAQIKYTILPDNVWMQEK